ncbi:hypothetical protein MBANPS3_000066 [Mucor bainieri]
MLSLAFYISRLMGAIIAIQVSMYVIATAAAAKTTFHRHAYSTASSSSPKGAGSFYYQYGTPLVKCIVLASATTLGFQLLWQHLEYQEYRDEADAYVTKLENRLKSLEEQQQQQQQQ